MPKQTKTRHVTSKGLTPTERAAMELRADVVILRQALTRWGAKLPPMVTHRLRFTRK